MEEGVYFVSKMENERGRGMLTQEIVQWLGVLDFRRWDLVVSCLSTPPFTFWR